ncbi:hypothetical protein [Streptococcus sp. zg-JUN1979]|uniref:hypothetical protein n=1 Tax=Streptococcus sp. zg-JUN1979 TaxID=3391450 RepID=UPI0039A705A4
MIEKNNLSEDDKKRDEFEDILALMDEVDACLGRKPKPQTMTMNQCLKEYVHKDAIKLIGHVIPRYTPLIKRS